jgi:hypothetical protein
MMKYSDAIVATLTAAERDELRSEIRDMDDAESRQDALGLIRARQRLEIELRKLRAAKLGRELKGWGDLG